VYVLHFGADKAEVFSKPRLVNLEVQILKTLEHCSGVFCLSISGQDVLPNEKNQLNLQR
jgi:hypothetical protein